MKLELESFLYLHNINIVLMSETLLCSNLKILKIRGYLVHLANHPRGATRGGSTVIIKKTISHYNIGAFYFISIQSSIIAIELNNQRVAVGSIYCFLGSSPPSADFETPFTQLGNRWIFNDDYNSKHPSWVSRFATLRGRVMYNLSWQVNCHMISSAGPTSW